MHTLLIFLGTGLGGIARFWVSNGIHWLLGRQFPYGTLVVNATGSFFMGVFMTLILARFSGVSHHLRGFLLIGFLGGYTTFSTFSIETFNLLESGAWMSAMLNVLFNVLLCITLAWLGVLCGRQL